MQRVQLHPSIFDHGCSAPVNFHPFLLQFTKLKPNVYVPISFFSRNYKVVRSQVHIAYTSLETSPPSPANSQGLHPSTEMYYEGPAVYVHRKWIFLCFIKKSLCNFTMTRRKNEKNERDSVQLIFLTNPQICALFCF